MPVESLALHSLPVWLWVSPCLCQGLGSHFKQVVGGPHHLSKDSAITIHVQRLYILNSFPTSFLSSGPSPSPALIPVSHGQVRSLTLPSPTPPCCLLPPSSPSILAAFAWAPPSTWSALPQRSDSVPPFKPCLKVTFPREASGLFTLFNSPYLDLPSPRTPFSFPTS